MAHPTEKSGNTSWVECPQCRNWFPVSGALLRAIDVEMRCPRCGRMFMRADAARALEAPGD